MILPHLTVRRTCCSGRPADAKAPGRSKKSTTCFPFCANGATHPASRSAAGSSRCSRSVARCSAIPACCCSTSPPRAFAGLVDELAAVFNRIRAAGVGVLIVEQHLSLVRRVSQRFVVMAKGQIIDRGFTAEIDAERHKAALAF